MPEPDSKDWGKFIPTGQEYYTGGPTGPPPETSAGAYGTLSSAIRLINSSDATQVLGTVEAEKVRQKVYDMLELGETLPEGSLELWNIRVSVGYEAQRILDASSRMTAGTGTVPHILQSRAAKRIASEHGITTDPWYLSSLLSPTDGSEETLDEYFEQSRKSQPEGLKDYRVIRQQTGDQDDLGDTDTTREIDWLTREQAATLRETSEMPEDTPEQVKAKRRAYNNVKVRFLSTYREDLEVPSDRLSGFREFMNDLDDDLSETLTNFADLEAIREANREIAENRRVQEEQFARQEARLERDLAQRKTIAEQDERGRLVRELGQISLQTARHAIPPSLVGGYVPGFQPGGPMESSYRELGLPGFQPRKITGRSPDLSPIRKELARLGG